MNIRDGLKSSTANLLMRYSKEISNEFPELVRALMEKPFRASDTGIHPKVLADWNRNGLLLSDHEKNKRHDFSLTEVVWIKMIEKFRQYNFSLGFIRSFRNELIVEHGMDIGQLMQNEDMLNAVLNMFPEEQQSKVKTLFSEPGMFEKMLQAMPFDTSQVNNFEVVVLFCLAMKKPLSVFVDHEGNGTFFSPIFLEEQEIGMDEFNDIMVRSHVSISVSEAIADVLGQVPMEKLTGRYGFMTSDEAKVIAALKSKELTEVTIRFDKHGEMDLLKLTENKKIDSRARLMEILMMKGYQDITVKTQEGNVVFCENTRKIKLK